MKFLICTLLSFSLFASFADKVKSHNRSQGVSSAGITGPTSRLDTTADVGSGGSVICSEQLQSVPKEFLDLIALEGKFELAINEDNEISTSSLRYADCLNGKLQIGVDKNAGVAGRVVVVGHFINGATMSTVMECVEKSIDANDGSSERTISPNPFKVEDMQTDSAVVIWGFKGSKNIFENLTGVSADVKAREQGNCYNIQEVEDNSLIAYTDEGRKWSNIKAVCESGVLNDIIDELEKNREYSDIQRVLEFAGMKQFEQLIRAYPKEIIYTDPPSNVTKSNGEFKDFHEKLKKFLVGKDDEQGLLHRWQKIRNKKGIDDGKYDREIETIDEFLKLVGNAFGPGRDIMDYLAKEGAYDDVKEASYNGTIALIARSDRSKKQKPKSIINRANRQQRQVSRSANNARRQRERHDELTAIAQGDFDPASPKSRLYMQRYASRMNSYRNQQEDFGRFQRDAYRSLNRRCNGVIQNSMFTFQLPRVNSRRSYENCQNLQQNFSRQADGHRARMNRTLQQAQGFQREADEYARHERIGYQKYMEENSYFDGFSDSEFLDSPYLDDYDLYTQFGSQDRMDPRYYGMNMPPISIDPTMYAVGSPAGPDYFGGSFGRNRFRSYSPSMFGDQYAPGIMSPSFRSQQDMFYMPQSGRTPAGMFHYSR